MKIDSIGEFGLIGGIRSRFKVPFGVTGIGDDCAIIPQEDGYQTLISTDMLVEGVHFLKNDASPYDIGWKSAAVNISDIAAMGGEPQATFLSFSLPKDLDVAWVDGFMDGYADISEQYGVPLLGGDTTSSIDRVCICVTVMGRSLSGRVKRRVMARAGDVICVTGPLGDSACGLKVILDGLERGEDELHLVERHYRPHPRVVEGLALSSLEGVHAMMDISDGIGSDLGHILKASQVGAKVNRSDIPLSEALVRVCDRYGWDAYEFAVNGGEDYELLFTAEASCLPQINIDYHIIGEIISSREIISDGLRFEGFRHF